MEKQLKTERMGKEATAEKSGEMENQRMAKTAGEQKKGLARKEASKEKRMNR